MKEVATNVRVGGVARFECVHHQRVRCVIKEPTMRAQVVQSWSAGNEWQASKPADGNLQQGEKENAR